jgi:vacuolar-type H+-ATPase subunit I/STV1
MQDPTFLENAVSITAVVGTAAGVILTALTAVWQIMARRRLLQERNAALSDFSNQLDHVFKQVQSDPTLSAEARAATLRVLDQTNSMIRPLAEVKSPSYLDFSANPQDPTPELSAKVAALTEKIERFMEEQRQLLEKLDRRPSATDAPKSSPQNSA